MPEYLEATIGSVALTVMPEPDWGSALREADESENVYADIATQLRPRTSALRHMKFKAKLTCADKDTLIADENALRAELAKPFNTLTLKPRNATNAVTFNLGYNREALITFDYLYDRACVGIYDIELVADPWGYGPSETLYTAAPLTSPDVAQLGTLVGQSDPRLSLTLTRTWSGSGAGMQFACVALCPSDSTAADFVYEAEASDLYGDWYDYDGNANCYGGHAARLDASDTTDWLKLGTVVPAGGPPPGRYRVMARARATSGGEGYLAKRKQYDEARDPSTTVTLNASVLAWHDLGEWVHYGDVPLRLYGKAATGGLYIDRVVLVPVDYGLVWYTDDAEDTHSVRFGWLYDHAFTTTEATTTEADATGRMQGHGLKVPREDFALFVFVEPNGSDPSPGVTLDASYLPRWEMFR